MMVCAIIQARMGSSRLPGKVLALLDGKPMLQRIVERVNRSQHISELIVVTSELAADDPIEALCSVLPGVICYRGSEEDVLDRFHVGLKDSRAEVVVRLTADDPFFDSEIIDCAIESFERAGSLDYLFYRKGLPLGTAVEVVSRSALDRAWREATDRECREHVTPYIYRNPELFKFEFAPCEGRDLSGIRLTVDTEEDLQVARWVYEKLGDSGFFSLKDVVKLIEGSDVPLQNQDVRQKLINYTGETSH